MVNILFYTLGIICFSFIYLLFGELYFVHSLDDGGSELSPKNKLDKYSNFFNLFILLFWPIVPVIQLTKFLGNIILHIFVFCKLLLKYITVENFKSLFSGFKSFFKESWSFIKEC